MANQEKTIYVYENWTDLVPKQIGKLCVRCVRGEEIFSFEFLPEFLKSTKRFLLDPDLEFYEGKQFLPNEKKQFGIFMDSEPDRWGRTLLKKKENIVASKEDRPINKLYETDFLLGVDDFTRIGALRFKTSQDGQFLAENDGIRIPPMKRLRELEAASLQYEKNISFYDRWIDILLTPGSSLGGARPKANVLDVDGSLWIAKFPSNHDEYDVGAWEHVVHELARLCGINVPEAKLQKFSQNGSTFISKRFDRDGLRRIHFASAMTMLNKDDGESSETSYVELAEFIRGYGSKANDDLIELWKRMVFSMLVKNSDDHLRNHGFLLNENGWRLSPMYDVNPNPSGRYLSLNVIDNSNQFDLDLALSVVKYFNISKDDGLTFIKFAKSIIEENWIKLAKKDGISDSSIKFMENAFIPR